MTPAPALLRELQGAAWALQRGDAAAAVAAARRALVLAPEDADAWNLLGVASAQLGQSDQAAAALQRAVAARPSYRNAWDNLIALLEQSGHLLEAAEAAERALREGAPGGVEAWHAAGLLHYRAGNPMRAGLCVETALQGDPSSRRYRHDLAVIRYAEQRSEEARELIAGLVESPQASLEERANFVAIWTRATAPADLERALEQARIVLAQRPAHANVLDSSAIILGKLGRRQEAQDCARRSLAADPGNPAALYTLARLLDEDARQRQALAELLARPQLLDLDARLPRQQGTVLLKLGEPASALQALDHALRLAAADQAAIALRGLALYQLGRTQEARDWWGQERFLARLKLATPSTFASREEWLAALAEDIRRHSRLRFEPIGLAAQGGWLTDELLADRTPAILGFHDSLQAAIRAYISALPADPAHPFLRVARSEHWTMHIWATRSVEGGVIDTHIHEDSWLSGAFYVELPPGMGEEQGGDRHAGWIEYGKPYRGLPDIPAEEHRRYQPAAGDLLLFPSYVFHRTLPFAGSGERISISFDLSFAS